MTPNDLKSRTKQFALRILRTAEAMPRTITGRALANQFARSGTAVAANYRAACRGRSRAEFIAKLGIVEEEADETLFWLELAIESGALPANRLSDLLEEANQLIAIFVASRKPARTSLNRQSKIGNRKSVPSL